MVEKDRSTILQRDGRAIICENIVAPDGTIGTIGVHRTMAAAHLDDFHGADQTLGHAANTGARDVTIDIRR